MLVIWKEMSTWIRFSSSFCVFSHSKPHLIEVKVENHFFYQRQIK